MIPLLMSVITQPYGLLVRLASAGSLVANNTVSSIYSVWMRASTGILNYLISFIVEQWFRLNDVSITIGEFGFFFIKGVKICWNVNDPGLTIEEARLKAIEWDIEKLRDVTVIFDIHRVRRELTNLKAAKSDAYISFTLHWKAHSLGDILSSDFYNDNDFIPALFTVLHATDVNIASGLRTEKEGPYIALLEVSVVDGHLQPSKKVKSFSLKAKDVTLCCGPYDRNLLQARREKILDMSVMELLVTSYLDGPSQLAVCFQGVHLSVCPTKINSVLMFLNHFLRYTPKIKEDLLSGLPIHRKLKYNLEESLEINAKSDNLKVSVCLQDGEEAITIFASFCLCHHQRTTKRQTNGSVQIQLLVPNRQLETADPCLILGNELISAPWEFTFTGSDWEGHSMLSRMTSDQSLSLVLRPECVPVFHELHEDYLCLLDQVQLKALLVQVKNVTRDHSKQSSIGKEICVNCKGVTIALEVSVFEELLKVSMEDIKAEFNQDQHHMMIELFVQELEIEDCLNKVLAFRRQHSSENISRPLIRSSLLQDAVSEDGKIIVKGFHTSFADSIVIIEETLLLKLLQFAGIKEKSQLRAESTEGQESGLNPFPAFSLATEYFFERLEVEPFQVNITCTPASDLTDELKNLKLVLEIPAGVPPLMDRANVTIGVFFRIGIAYKTLHSLAYDARTHYIKEIGRQSTSLLGSLHLLGNLSSLHGDITEGLADLKETGDYLGFVKHVRGGLLESYNKFADSWTATIAQSTTRTTEGVLSVWDTTDTRDDGLRMRRTMRGVVGSLVSFLGNSSPDTTRDTAPLQLSILPGAPPPMSPSMNLSSKSLNPTEILDHDVSSESGESSLSFSQPLDGCEPVPRAVSKKCKRREFLRLLQLSLSGAENRDEVFVSWLKLRHENPVDKLDALVTNENVYFLKTGLPTAENVILTIRLDNLYKAQSRKEGGVCYLELLMRVSGQKRLSLPSPNPADSPLVRCSSIKTAQRAADVINRAKRKDEDYVER